MVAGSDIAIWTLSDQQSEGEVRHKSGCGTVGIWLANPRGFPLQLLFRERMHRMTSSASYSEIEISKASYLEAHVCHHETKRRLAVIIANKTHNNVHLPQMTNHVSITKLAGDMHPPPPPFFFQGLCGS